MPFREPLTANSVVRVWTSRVAVGTERDAAIVRALHRQAAVVGRCERPQRRFVAVLVWTKDRP